MKAIIINGEIQVFRTIPKVWNGILNYHNPKDPNQHYDDGWRDLEVPEYDSTTHKLTSTVIEDTDNDRFIYEIVELTERELIEREINLLAQQGDSTDEKVFSLIRKINRFVETDDKNVLVEDEPDIPYENGIEVFKGQVVIENEERYSVRLPSFITQELWRPSILYEQQGNRTLWRKKQTDIPQEDLCTESPDWNIDNWNDYIVGYHVKHDSAIWKATNLTHTWIAPAHSGDGAISWEHVKDCS